MVNGRPNAEQTLTAAYRLFQCEYQRGEVAPPLACWLLPAAVEQWGIGHADTRRLVQQAAGFLCESTDPREHLQLTQTVTELAQQLPGGLGWANTVVAPVPDEEAFNRHCALHQRAHLTMPVFGTGETVQEQDAYKLAKQMLQRCVSYYDTLGQHWLAMARKFECKGLICSCIRRLEGYQEAEAMLQELKREARRELGPNHPCTLTIIW